jgi:hypothetical protein
LFFAGLQQYQQQFADSTALGVDFIAVMEDVTNMDFTAFMEEWYFGEGYPIYSVRWNNLGTEVLVEINQQTSASAITPFFTNDLELRFDRQGVADTNMRFTITGTQNQFIIPNPGNIVGVLSIDPRNWICNGNLGVTEDNEFVTGLPETTTINELTIFPNPANGPFTVSMSSKGAYVLTIIDTKGRVLKHLSFEQEQLVDLSNSASGTYLVQVESAEGKTFRRLVKK